MEIDLNSHSKKIKKGNRFFFFILTVLCVSACVVISQFLASTLTTDSLGFSTSASTNSSAEYKLYALSLASYSSAVQAEDYALNVKRLNAGGFVWEKDSKFYVLASIYEKKNDAESVLKNLTDNSKNAEIIEIVIEKVNFNKINSNNLKKEYSDIISNLKEVYKDIYDISVSIDTSVYSETKCKIELDSVKTNLENDIDKLSTGTTANEGVFYATIKNSVDKILDTIEDCIDFDPSESYLYSSKIKNTYIQIVDRICSLVDNLNEI